MKCGILFKIIIIFKKYIYWRLLHCFLRETGSQHICFLFASYITWLRYYHISCDFILSLLEDIFPGWHAPMLITTEHNLQRWNRSSLRPSALVWLQSCYGLYLLSLFFRDCAKTKLMIKSISQASLPSPCQLKVWPLRADELPKINLFFFLW